MSETNAQEPTMEEILASIRRIISEDDPPADAAAAEPAGASAAIAAAPHAVAEAPKPRVEAPPPEPAAAPAHDEDVLELTDAVEPTPPPSHHTYEETVGDLDVFASAPTPSAPAFTPAASAFPAEPLVGSYASETSAGHFGALARSLAMPKDSRTLEDVVRELLKPLLRDWLDQNLPAIVEARVQAEVERIARRNEY